MIYKMESHTLIRVICIILYGQDIFVFVANENDFVASELEMYSDKVKTNNWIVTRNKSIHFIGKDTNSSVLQAEFDAFVSSFTNPLQSQVVYDQLQYCPFRPLCTSNWTVINLEKGYSFCCEECSCESDCEEYGTCCPDVLPSTKYNYALHHRHCFPLTLKSTFLSTDGVFAYTTCPYGTDLETRDLCTDITEGATELLDILPVIDRNNVIYRNIYCARCNRADNATFLTPKITCTGGRIRFSSEKELITAVLKHPTCNMVFEAPNNNATIGRNKCNLASVSICNVSRLWTNYNAYYEWACGLYSSPVYTEGTLYQNIFCALCNGLKDVDRYCYDPLIHELDNFGVVVNVQHHILYDKDVEEHMTKSEEECEKGFVRALDMCIKASCSSIRILTGNKCERTTSYPINSYKISFRLVPLEFIQTKIAYHIVDTLKEFLESNVIMSIGVSVEIDDVQSILVTNRLYHTSMTIDEIFDSALIYIDIRYKFSVNGSNDAENMLQMLKNKSEEIVNAGQDKHFVIHIKDDPGKKYERIEYEHNLFFINRSLSDRIIDLLPDLNTENEYTKLGYAPNDFNVPINIEEFTPTTYENLLSMKKCTFVELSNDRLSWTETITGLRFSNGYPSLKFSEFLYSIENASVILVCLDTYIDILEFSVPKKVESVRKYEDIVSAICVALSIMCLLFTCFTFIILPAFKSLPWRNNLALSLSLLFTQIMYVLSYYLPLDKKSVYCKALGLLFHFFLLQYIFWINICTFHMYRVLTKTKLISITSGRKRLFLYAAYSFIATACFVTVNILYSSYGKSIRDFGYGGTVCYINSQLMVIMSFGVPLILVLVSNLVMTCLVIYKIKKTTKIQKNVKNDTHILTVIAKLTIITGLTWVFGILYMFVNHPVFSFIFIIVNGSQGVFLTISFVLNKKTRVMYKATMSRSGNKSVKSSKNLNSQNT